MCCHFYVTTRCQAANEGQKKTVESVLAVDGMCCSSEVVLLNVGTRGCPSFLSYPSNCLECFGTSKRGEGSQGEYHSQAGKKYALFTID